MSKEEEDFMSVVQQFKTSWSQTKNEELLSAVSELRELGEELEGNDPHFFEEEKFLSSIQLAKKIAKEVDLSI